MKEAKNSLTFPTWVIAIVAVLTFLMGFFGKGFLNQKKFTEYEQQIEYLKIPGKNPKVVNGFEYKLLDLSFVERNVSVDVLVTSQETSKDLSIKRSSRIIDNFGNVYKPVEMQLGADIDNYTAKQSLPANVGIIAKFKFENLSSEATGFKLFEINTNKGIIEFTNDDFIDLKNRWLKSK